VRPAYGDYRWRRRERARGLRAIHNGGADLTKGTAGARLVFWQLRMEEESAISLERRRAGGR